ncbi:MAG: lysophospholipid acyltransferase family protein [Acidobacteria bacterium]|nr:lysophospholipid acyltransferase family protein [Acidobacteriota bacterium]
MFYDLIASMLRPIGWWGRLRVEGLEHVPETGPLLVVPNHDSQWDPVLVGLAIRPRRRVRFLARANLWHVPGLGPALNALQQLPVTRGTGDSAALDRAVEALWAGDAVAIFPEGRLSWGEAVRARSGVGVLAGRCSAARVVLCAVEGTTAYVRWPRRPRVTVRFMAPASGQPRPGEDPAALAARLLQDLRDRVPVTPAGRRAIVGGPPRVRQAMERRRLAPRAGD